MSDKPPHCIHVAPKSDEDPHLVEYCCQCGAERVSTYIETYEGHGEHLRAPVRVWTVVWGDACLNPPKVMPFVQALNAVMGV